MKLKDMKYRETSPLSYGEKAQEIRSWMNQVANIPDNMFSINKDLSVDVHEHVSVLHKSMSIIPVQFRDVAGMFNVNRNKLQSLEGSPRSCKGFTASDNKLESAQIKYLPSINGGNCNLSSNEIKSLQGIHKVIKQMNGIFSISHNPVQSHVLGLLLIKGLTEIDMSSNTSFDLIEVSDILNKHLKNRDIIACQQELIDTGYEEYARL